jgi:putative ABC transport system permease protein
MDSLKLISLAWKALLRNKIRTFLTMLGIIIGVAAVITMVSIGEGSKQSIRSQLSSMGSNMITVRPFSNSTVGGGARLGSSGLQTLKTEDAVSIQNQAVNITYVSPAVSTRGQAINASLNWPTSLQGVSPSYLDIRNWAVSSGVSFTDADVISSAKVCLIGQTVIKNIFPDGQSPVGSTIRFNKIPFKVIGVLEMKGENTFGQDQDDIILAPYTTVQKRIMAINYIQNIYASAVDENSSGTATAEVTAILRANHQLKTGEEDDFSVRTQAELISTASC